MLLLNANSFSWDDVMGFLKTICFEFGPKLIIELELAILIALSELEQMMLSVMFVWFVNPPTNIAEFPMPITSETFPTDDKLEANILILL